MLNLILIIGLFSGVLVGLWLALTQGWEGLARRWRYRRRRRKA